MNELRIVFDCNVAVSAVLLRNSLPRQAIDIASTKGKLLVSSSTVEVLTEVLQRSKFDRYLTDRECSEFLTALVNVAELVVVTESVHDCRDPKDNKYLELAVSGRASHVVSGDADLLALHPFRGIAILTPQAFLESLAE